MPGTRKNKLDVCCAAAEALEMNPYNSFTHYYDHQAYNIGVLFGMWEIAKEAGAVDHLLNSAIGAVPEGE